MKLTEALELILADAQYEGLTMTPAGRWRLEESVTDRLSSSSGVPEGYRVRFVPRLPEPRSRDMAEHRMPAYFYIETPTGESIIDQPIIAACLFAWFQ